MKRHMKVLAIWSLLFFLIQGVCIVLVSGGTVQGQYHGFAVDDDGNVYIGSNGEIWVYADSRFVRKIEVPAKSFAFTIDDENQILLWNSVKRDCIQRFDLDGNLIKQEQLPKNLLSYHTFYEQYVHPSASENVFVSSNGDTYVKLTVFLRPQIYSEDGLVYQQSAPAYAIRLLELVILVTFPFILAAVFVLKEREKQS